MKVNEAKLRASGVAAVVGALVALGMLAGEASACGGDGESLNPLPSSGGAGGGGGAGGASTTPSGGGQGGAGGGAAGGTNAGGSGLGGGGGGTGGAAASCIPASRYDDLFTIADDALCAVAAYAGDGAFDFHVTSISFGAHGGPLILQPSATAGSVDLLRYAPHGMTFSLTTATADAAIPAGTFLGAQALDLGFFGWTAIGYAGAFPATQGEIILLDGTTVATRYPVNSPFAFGAVVDSTDAGRLVYTGLSRLDDAAAAENGLYAADSCGTSTMNPSLEPGAVSSCNPPSQVSPWGDFSGPVAVDALGDAFAVLTSFAGDQEARGFAQAEIGRGAQPAHGTPMFTLPGFGSALAAMAPTPTEDGILAFQPSDGTTFEALDVVAQRYEVVSGALAAVGTPTPMLTLTQPDTPVGLANDPEARIWVAASRGTGPSAKLVFVVLARKPQ